MWRYRNEREEAKISQGARKFKKDEEMGHHQEISRTGLIGKRREVLKKAWRLEREGETEVPEIIIVSVAVGSTKVDLDGKSHREHAEAKISRREREAPDEEGEEIKNPKRKVIRVESEETQDYVREAKSAEQEEVEERFFAASASNVPQKMMFSLRQAMQREVTQLLAAGVCVVINEGGKSYTTN